jgi:flagellar hook-associated protein 2
LTVDKTGSAKAILLDASGSALSLNEVTSARDAVLLHGTAGAAGSVLLTSQTNDFSDAVEGLNITVKDGTRQPLTVNVTNSTANITKAVQEFVDAYNSIRTSLDQTTSFDQDALTIGILFGTSAALRVDSGLSQLISGRFFGVGSVDSLAVIGIRLNDKGKLDFDQTKFASALASDPDGVQRLFTEKDKGVAAKLSSEIERLAGVKNSLLSNRTESLVSTIESNNERIESLQLQLDRQRARLTADFQRIDTAIAKFQQNQAALSSLQIIPPLGTTSS